jgi:MarR family 2-MHQ and catechol resistance regulon transcriptional repressor
MLPSSELNALPTHHQGSEEERLALNLFIALSRGAEAFFSRLHGALGSSDLTPSQFGVLETLFHLGPLTSSQLAEKHLRSRNNLSVVIRNLERDGLVVRKTCPMDRRAHWIELTDAGRNKISQLFPIFLRGLVKECGVLEPSEQAVLRDLLKKLGRNSPDRGADS